jgi:hypothetical protein
MLIKCFGNDDSSRGVRSHAPDIVQVHFIFSQHILLKRQVGLVQNLVGVTTPMDSFLVDRKIDHILHVFDQNG